MALQFHEEKPSAAVAAKAEAKESVLAEEKAKLGPKAEAKVEAAAADGAASKEASGSAANSASTLAPAEASIASSAAAGSAAGAAEAAEAAGAAGAASEAVAMATDGGKAGSSNSGGDGGACSGSKPKKEKKDAKSDEESQPRPAGLQGVRINLVGGSDSKKLIRVAGHEVHFYRLSEGMIVKQSTTAERDTYKALRESRSLAPFAPRCYRAVDRGSHVLLYIEDLTAAYTSPCVMDVKMGTRTFQEKEADNPKRRLDLKDKMLVHPDGPSELTADELATGVTKLRYMQFREACSTSATHGWRIEGIHLSGAAAEKVKVSKDLKHRADVLKTLTKFVQSRASVATDLCKQFTELRTALEASEWFMGHEIVSSSLLIIYDGAQSAAAPPTVAMIDFANTFPVQQYELTKLEHRGAWQKGNHEEGYLDGLDSLVDCFGALGAALEQGRDDRL